MKKKAAIMQISPEQGPLPHTSTLGGGAVLVGGYGPASWAFWEFLVHPNPQNLTWNLYLKVAIKNQPNSCCCRLKVNL